MLITSDKSKQDCHILYISYTRIGTAFDFSMHNIITKTLNLQITHKNNCKIEFSHIFKIHVRDSGLLYGVDR